MLPSSAYSSKSQLVHQSTTSLLKVIISIVPKMDPYGYTEHQCLEWIKPIYLDTLLPNIQDGKQQLELAYLSLVVISRKACYKSIMYILDFQPIHIQ